jgi:hypothetical protein
VDEEGIAINLENWTTGFADELVAIFIAVVTTAMMFTDIWTTYTAVVVASMREG